METFGVYNLKADIILTVFWGIYLIFLQKGKNGVVLVTTKTKPNN